MHVLISDEFQVKCKVVDLFLPLHFCDPCVAEVNEIELLSPMATPEQCFIMYVVPPLAWQSSTKEPHKFNICKSYSSINVINYGPTITTETNADNGS